MKQETTPYRATPEVASKNTQLTKYMVAAVVTMFLFGFASIPLYRLFCAMVAPGGSSWFIGEADVYEGVEVDRSRQLRVRFATNVERQLPWDFYGSEHTVTVHPGEKRLVEFFAMNKSSLPVTGKAVYDINPPAAAPYFKKIECFCFIEQELSARQEMDMPLYFWFEPEIPDHVTDITIGYTFFNSGSSFSRAQLNR